MNPSFGAVGACLARRGIAAIALGLLLAGSTAASGPAVRSLLEMRRENVVIQQWDLSCGAAALATVLRYQFGVPVSEKEMARVLMQRADYRANPQLVQLREGFSLLDLKRAAAAHGHQGSGFGQLTLDDLLAKAPVIVPVRSSGYNHFVVFRGMRGNRVLLADSAWGNRTMLADAFVASWIEYPQLGRVGFVVESQDGAARPNLLAPRSQDFVMLR
jgi:predicted double-glycine peptidase